MIAHIFRIDFKTIIDHIDFKRIDNYCKINWKGGEVGTTKIKKIKI